MGNRKSWPQRLADRFQAVGWEVKLGAGGHYKVRRPDGQLMSWPQSPSGNRTQDNKEAEARRFGLHLAEEELEKQRELERQARIEQDRLANGVPETRFIAPEPSPEKEDEKMAATSKYGYIEVEGVKLGIAEVAKPVMHQHPRGGEPHTLSHCRELLLVDDSIRYQCLKLLPGPDGKICARHFATSAGLVVHWNRGSHADAEQKETRNLGPSAEPNPVEPRPGPTKEEIIADRVPASIYTMPDPRSNPKPEAGDLAVPTGLVAQAVHQVGRLRILESTLDDLAEQAGSIASELERIVEKLPEELVSPELQAKAEKFDRMMGALGQ